MMLLKQKSRGCPDRRTAGSDYKVRRPVPQALLILLLPVCMPRVVTSQPQPPEYPECSASEKSIVYRCAQYSDYMQACLEHTNDGCIWCPQYKTHVKTRNLCRTAQQCFVWVAWGESQQCVDQTGNSVFRPTTDPESGIPITPALDPQHLCFADIQQGCKSPFDGGVACRPHTVVAFCSAAVIALNWWYQT